MGTRKGSSITVSNNTWHSFDANSTTAVVFVHGFFSSAASCWQDSSGTFWPDLILSDPRIPKCSIFLGGYYTAINSRDYGVGDCAKELLGALRRNSSDGLPAPLASQNIIFVCHSLGGIVVRAMLESYESDFRNKNIGLCLIASPSLGSKYANISKGLIEAFNNRLGRQLKLFNPFLEELDERFSRFLERREPGTFYGAEAIEHHPPILSWLRFAKPIVGKQSAGRYFASRRTLPNTTHSSIVKPSNIEHPAHEFLVDFFDQFKPAQAVPVIGPPPSPLTPLDVLFDAYEKRFEPFYIQRTIDSDISGNAALRSVWLSGPSGIGKTCALKRHLSNHKVSHYHVCLSQCGTSPTAATLIREISQTFQQIAGTDIDESYSGVCGFLSARARSNPVTVYFDEVASGPTGAQAALELLQLLTDILSALKQRTDVTRVTFVVSSLVAPNHGSLDNREKIYEQFAFVGADTWSDEDLGRLYIQITSTLRDLAPKTDQQQKIVLASRGSPRFLKNVFRNMYVMQSNERSLDVAVARAREQLGS